MDEKTTWRILFADDDQKQCQQIKQYLGRAEVTDIGEKPEVTTTTEFSEVLGILEKQRFDIVILDVRLGALTNTPETEAGVQVLEDIRKRRFVPVVFYTALPAAVRHLASPVVAVVDKTDGLPGLLSAVKEVFANRLPAINRALIRLIESEQRAYMWGFVAEHWTELGGSSDKSAVAYLLARRFASAISGTGIDHLTADLGGESGICCEPDKVPPVRYYIIPPLESSKPQTGNIYRGTGTNSDLYSILLTPACDLVQDKADKALLASCVPLVEMDELKQWKTNGCHTGRNNHYKNLCALLANNKRERHYCLPGVFDLPDLIVDFQQVTAVSLDDLSKMRLVATLDSPFAEALQARYSRYCGRIGTPDLDYQSILGRHSTSKD